MKSYSHMCRLDHLEIGYADGCEICPLCAVIAQRDALADELEVARRLIGKAHLLADLLADEANLAADEANLAASDAFHGETNEQ